MELEDNNVKSNDLTVNVTRELLNEKIAILNNKVLDLKIGMRLLEMENKNTRDELLSDIKLIRRVNKLLLGFVVIFEACLIVALR
jgi:flagellar biosynthesis component FlhA